jgi:hypothetical protein
MNARKPRTPGHWILALSLGLGHAFSGQSASAAPPESRPTIGFDQQIRPILSDHCFQCHGPDTAKRKGKLRLDVEPKGRIDGDGVPVIVPGDRDTSEVFQRISSTDPDEQMPPPAAGKPLTPAQIRLIGDWISQGAKWQGHWSFATPRRPPAPPVKNRTWVRNPIDEFVLARLERERLAPSPEAARHSLIRRLALDLTGLPPTLAEVNEFARDPAPDAYNRVVDRLLASPRFGERMAIRWLNAARYADTSGYQTDGDREMWRWRDWVIDAYNRDMPFDAFTIEQLAGDLLPGATLDQRIATGFNRNHRGNSEGGIIPEEYAVEYVVDRVETTSTVWLGLTVGCARCHNHKFDPISQTDFYRLFAFFNNVPEQGRALKYGNSPPFLLSPTRAQQERLAALDARLQAARAHDQAMSAEREAAQARWERTAAEPRSKDRGTEPPPTMSGAVSANSCRRGLRPPIPEFPALRGDRTQVVSKVASGPKPDWTFQEHLLARFAYTGAADASPTSAPLVIEETKRRPEAFTKGPVGRAIVLDGVRGLEAGDVGAFGFLDRFTLACWIRPDDTRGGTIVSRMLDEPQGEGYCVELVEGRIQVNLVKRWLDDAIRVRSTVPVVPGRWTQLAVCYDGSRKAAGVAIYLDGRQATHEVLLDELNQTFLSKNPFRIGAGGGSDSRYRGAVDDVRIHDDVLSAQEIAVLATPESLATIAAIPPARRSPAQAHKLQLAFLETPAAARFQRARKQVLALELEKRALMDHLPTTMVMSELPQPRATHVLVRGQYDRPGERVEPGVPGCLPPWPSRAPLNRLGLAKWLVDPANPLTARVEANRLWQMFFGAGLVKTVEDFGSQGERPSHPELLDWLATELVRSDWDVKSLIRIIVTSASYRQSSRMSRELLDRDPENRLLARGPRLRLSAEMIRDQALALSGLLVERLGGPSVKPYQPPGLWSELGDASYVQDRGAALYRRGLYTFWKRTVAPPSLAAFDAPGREMCTVRESRTNTPLQALVMMNDPTFVEAAQALATRVMHEGGETLEEKLSWAFRAATGRSPGREELSVLAAGFRDQQTRFRGRPETARALVERGDHPALSTCEAAELDLAAMAVITQTILNLDEALTKE